jgi:hypothetical protein
LDEGIYRYTMKVKLGDIVDITWEDAWADSKNYYTVESIKDEKPYIGHTIGKVIRHDKHGTTIAQEYGFGERAPDYRRIHHVPRSMVRKIKVLK